MRDWGGSPGLQHLLLAEKLGLAMARRAADILDRHRRELALAPAPPAGAVDAAVLPGDATAPDDAAPADNAAAPDNAAPDDKPALADDTAQFAVDDAQFAADDAIFTAVLDAANDCIGRFDPRTSEERWCDALVQLLLLARLDPDAPAQSDDGPITRP